MIAASSTVAVIGPQWSSVQLSGITPCRLTLPYVGLNPTTLQNIAGARIDPRVHVAIDPMHKPADTATADPLLDPPAPCSRFHGLRGMG
jgi:hypothetical protein